MSPRERQVILGVLLLAFGVVAWVLGTFPRSFDVAIEAEGCVDDVVVQHGTRPIGVLPNGCGSRTVRYNFWSRDSDWVRLAVGTSSWACSYLPIVPPWHHDGLEIVLTQTSSGVLAEFRDSIGTGQACLPVMRK